MEGYLINGIQQVGVGVPQVYEGWKWYLENFNFDLPVFDEAAEAKLMLPYTDGLPRERHAVLALNYQGGGGLEIWQHKSFEPRQCNFKIMPGDLGICAIKIKARDVEHLYESFLIKGLNLISKPIQDPLGRMQFFLEDPYGNLINVIESREWHRDMNWPTGGVMGCTLGVTDINKSIEFYKDVLKYDKVTYHDEGVFQDINCLTPNGYHYERAILTHSKKRNGAFSNLLGFTEIELIKVKDRSPNRIFEGRMWGELGYIHLCFDVNGMDTIKSYCEKKGHLFTVDSGQSFDMGEAAGRFAYTEDPDGTLIEFVETHKIPVLKKLNLYYDLRKRKSHKPLSSLFLKAMSFMRVKSVPNV